MLGQPGKLWVRTAPGQDLGVAFRDRTAALALQRLGEDGCAAARPARTDALVDEVDQLVREADGYLGTHSEIVPEQYQNGVKTLGRHMGHARLLRLGRDVIG